MSAQETLLILLGNGAEVIPNGSKIRVIPANVLNDELRAAIDDNRGELLEFLLPMAQSTLANEAALELAHSRGSTANGYAVEFDAGEAYRAHQEEQEAA
jgi:hypothetical protein